LLTITTPDRLARSTAELLTIEADLTKHGIGRVIPSMGGEKLDTRKPTSKLMLTVRVATGNAKSCWRGSAKAKATSEYKGRPIGIDVAQVKLLRATLGPAAITKRLGIVRSSASARSHRWREPACI
jgi:hypothetical protein